MLLVVWTRVESKRPEPLIDLGILSDRAVATTNLTGFMIGFAMFSSFLLIPQFAQAPESTGYGFGASVTEAGLLLFPAAVAQLIAGPLAGRLGTIIGFRTTLAMGTSFASAAFVVLALQHQHEWDFVVEGGAYHGPDGVGEMRGFPKRVKASPDAYDPEIGSRLWQLSEELTGVRYLPTA